MRYHGIMGSQLSAETARLPDIRRVVEEGGYVRFVWASNSPKLVSADKETLIDLRSYHGFLKTLAPKLQRTETGSSETKDLVIEWKRK